jgi:transposase
MPRAGAVHPIKQRAALAVHGTRALLVQQRTISANALSAVLTELGIVAAKGLEGLRELVAGLEKPSAEIPEIIASDERRHCGVLPTGLHARVRHAIISGTAETAQESSLATITQIIFDFRGV